MNKKFFAAPVLILALLVNASCGSGGGGFNLMSVEEEWRLGEQISQDVARQVRLLNDPEALAYVNRVGQALVSQTNMGQLPWRFHIVDDPAINAFNIPGGHVYVNRGLITAADNASEFAGVLGHELSHGVLRHGTQQLSRQYGLSILASVVLGQNPGALQQIAAQIVGTGALARFSREHEREADELGVQMMAKAGYNPQGMVTMFEELLANEKSQPGKVAQFFSTHPLTRDRINEVTKIIQRMGNPSGRTDEASYQSIRRRLS